MARVEAQIPEKWKSQLEQIKKERGKTSIAQLVKDALYEKYFKSREKRNEL